MPSDNTSPSNPSRKHNNLGTRSHTFAVKVKHQNPAYNATEANWNFMTTTFNTLACVLPMTIIYLRHGQVASEVVDLLCTQPRIMSRRALFEALQNHTSRFCVFFLSLSNREIFSRLIAMTQQRGTAQE